MTTWIPDDPNFYLDSIHMPRPHNWTGDYAGWRYSYAPAFERLSQALMPGASFSQLERALRPYVHIAILNIPANLKIRCPNVQPTDWDSLPPEQIRSVYDNANTLFAKIVLSSVTLQILYLVRNGMVGMSATAAEDPRNAKSLKNALDGFTAEQCSVVRDIKIQLATNRFDGHDTEWWTDNVLKQPTVAADFRNMTLQTSPLFLKTFTDGGLATISTLKTVQEWHDSRFANHQLGAISHYYVDGKRILAAQKETVQELVTVSTASTPSGP